MREKFTALENTTPNWNTKFTPAVVPVLSIQVYNPFVGVASETSMNDNP